MRARHLTPLAALLLLPALAACGDDDPEAASSTPTPTESSPTASEEPTEAPSTAETTEAAPVLPASCDLVTADDVAKAMGVSVSAGQAGDGEASEGDLAWTYDECSFEATDLVTVRVRVTTAADFTAGDFTCPMPSDLTGTVEPADDVAGANEAWWWVSNPPTFSGELRACAPDHFVAVELAYEEGVDYEGDPRQQAGQMAQLALTNLQG